MKRYKLEALAAVAMALTAFGATAQQITPSQYQVQTTITVVPYAELTFLAGSLLYLKIPPGASTIPDGGVSFRVSGNAIASLTAEPSEFLQITTTVLNLGLGGPGTYFLGKATINGADIGYDLSVDFPMGFGNTARLPKNFAGPTPARLANVLPGDVFGTIDLITNAAWSNQGQLPLPGIYVGQVTLSLTAN